MLEPLIVLTVLNCFFMFSSTVTTCALWWQYRSHRCCFKKGTVQQSTRHNLSKGKHNNSSKKAAHIKQDNLVNLVDRSKPNSGATRESKCKRSCKQRPRSSNHQYQLQSKPSTAERISSVETIKNWELEERAKMSEACQTDAKSAVVMECSTVQKIVQILDNDMDLTATKLVIKDNAKQHIEEKKESIVEPPLEPLATLEYTAEEVEERN